MLVIEFIVRNVLHFMPIIFGFGFLGPLMAQIMDRLGWVEPLGLTNLALGLLIGGVWGLLAFFRGSWIWARP